MHEIIRSPICRRFALITLILGIFILTGFSQTVDPIAVDAIECFSDLDLHALDKPVLYVYGEALRPDEIHILDTLSDRERKFLEKETDPPAVGILRSLYSPVHFSSIGLNTAIEEEIFVHGGRRTPMGKDSLVWTTLIQSKGADEIRLFFSEGYIPMGIQVSLFGTDSFAIKLSELEGQIGEYGFYAPAVFSDEVLLQVVIPAENFRDSLYFIVPQVIHVDNRYVSEGQFRSCFEDVNCDYANSFSGIATLKKNTARLRFLVGDIYFQCSGGLLNDSRTQDFQPFLLTANHCFSLQPSANSLEARFDYYTTSCDGSINPDYIMINSSNLLATNSESDFTLVLLKVKPGGARSYLGWTTSIITDGTILHSVHHPEGTPQKYSRHEKETSPAFENCDNTPNFHYTNTLGGQTEKGSSGGLIVRPDLKVIGQLWGKCWDGSEPDACEYETYHNVWGKFSVSYSNNNLQYWLSEGGASVSMTTSPAITLDFGTVNVGSYLNKTVTVTNNGTVPEYLNLEAGDVSIGGLHAGQFSVMSAGFLYLSPGQSGTFTVRFTPSSLGAKTAALSIPHNADNISSPKTITLTGSGGGIDPCTGALVIDGCGPASSVTYPGGGTGVWYNYSANPCGNLTPGTEKIYSFVAPITGSYYLQVTEANGTVDYLWKGSACSSTGWICIGDVFSPGQYGSLSWTAGTTYYILLDDEDNVTGAHTFYLNYISAPDTLTLQNLVIPTGQTECEEALLCIVVAGDGTYYVVSDDASVTLVAGEQILLKPGFHALPGSYFHAYISDEGCMEPLKPVTDITASDDRINAGDIELTDIMGVGDMDQKDYLKVYPNPTTGELTIEIHTINSDELSMIQIYDCHSRIIQRKEMTGPGRTGADLSAWPSGMYLIRVIHGLKSETVKVIKQD